ncbi:MAG TPA: hypothetical protein VLT58_05615, partial [Polyangia bacterium]|nr:hypothetical protein [Polyangia bacterium]
QLCMQGCQKCDADAGATYVQLCNSGCTSMANTMAHCSNESAIASAAKTCVDMSTCDAITTCIQTSLPACEGGGGGSSGTGTGGAHAGTGGAGGHATGATGGTTGSAGNGGTADCSGCAKASACCAAEAALSGSSSASCSMFSVAKCNAGDTTSTADNCQTIVQVGASAGLAACQ